MSDPQTTDELGRAQKRVRERLRQLRAGQAGFNEADGSRENDPYALVRQRLKALRQGKATSDPEAQVRQRLQSLRSKRAASGDGAANQPPPLLRRPDEAPAPEEAEEESVGFLERALTYANAPQRGAIMATASMLEGAGLLGASTTPELAGIGAITPTRGLPTRAQEIIEKGRKEIAPDAMKNRRERMEAAIEGENAAAKMAGLMRDYAERRFPGSRDLQDDFVNQALEGLGSTAPYMAAGATSGGASLPVMGLMGVASSEGQMLQEARRSDATPEEVTKGMTSAAIGGAAEALPIERALGRLVPKPLKRKAVDSILGALEEASQETFQQVTQNLAAQAFDEDRDVLEGTGKAAAQGGTVGFLLNSLVGLLGGRTRASSGNEMETQQPEKTSTEPAGQLPTPREDASSEEDLSPEPADVSAETIDSGTAEQDAPTEEISSQGDAAAETSTEQSARKDPQRANRSSDVAGDEDATSLPASDVEGPSDNIASAVEGSQPEASTEPLPEYRTADSQYDVRPVEGGEGIRIVQRGREASASDDTGAISPGTQEYRGVLAEYLSQNAGAIEEATGRVRGERGRYAEAVARESQNPIEVLDALEALRSDGRQDVDDGVLRVLQENAPYDSESASVQSAVAGAEMVSEGDGFGAWVSPGRKSTKSLDQVADETGVDVSELVEIMRTPGIGPANAQTEATRTEQDLRDRFEELTGVRLTQRVEEELRSRLPEQEAASPVDEGPTAPFKGVQDLNRPSGTPLDQQRDMPAQEMRRIDVAPIEGGQARALDEMLSDVSEAIGRNVRVSKQPAGAGGSYNAGSARTSIRYAGDLDTAAHEIAHALDDKHGLVSEWSGEETSPFDDELIPRFSQYGSATESGERSSPTYKRAEGVAEWVRAWVVNPSAAKESAPDFAEHFEEKVPADEREALRQFSQEVREWAGAGGEGRTLANVEASLDEPGLMERVREALEKDQLGISWLTEVNTHLGDALAPVWKGIAYAKRVKGIEELLPGEDPQMLMRLWAGNDAKLDDIFEHGMIDAGGSRLEGPAGKGIPHLFEPLDTSSDAALQRDLEGVLALMVNERVLEKAEQMRQEGGRIEVNQELISELKQDLRKVEEKLETARRRRRSARGKLKRRQKKSADVAQEYLLSGNEWKRRRGQIEKWEERIDELRAERRELRGQIDAATVRLNDARRALDYDGASRNVAEYVEQRAARLAGTGAGLYSDERQAYEALEELQADPERFARAQEAAKRYRAWANAVLQYYRDKGRITQERYEQIRENNSQYVAMQRIMDTVSEELRPSGMGGSLGSVGQPIKRFRGSTRRIKNPYVSLLEQTAAMVKEADRNEALRSFRDLLATDRSLYDGDVLNLDAVGSEATSEDSDTISIFVDGVEEHWQFHPEIHQALKDWGDSSGDGAFLKALQMPARVMHSSITHAPSFLVRNVIRDPVQRGVVSRTGSSPVGQFRYLHPEGQEEFRKLWSDFHRYGGGMFGFYRGTRDGYMNRLRDALKEVSEDGSSILSTPKRLLSGYKRLAESTETVGRIEEFRSAYRKAKDELGYSEKDAKLYAAFEARNITDYAIAGRTIKKVNRFIPFTNAAVQGLLRSFRGARENFGGFAARWLGYVASVELANYLWNDLMGDDEELRQQPAYIRDLFWNFKVGPDLWLRIPKPWELGVAASGISRGIDWARGHENAFDGWGKSAVGALTPLDPSALMGPYKTFTEAFMSHYDSFRGRYVIPSHERDLDLELREGTKYASRVGQLIQGATGVDARSWDHFIENQFGGMGRLVTSASDLGRDDVSGSDGRSLGMEAAGVLVGSPAYSAKDVQFVYDWAARRGEEGSASVQRLRDLVGAYYDTENAEERDKLAQRLRTYASKLRRRIEAHEEKQEEEQKKSGLAGLLGL